MNEPGKILVIFGVVIVIAGLLLWSGAGKNWLGRLPGDISFEKGNFRFYFPIVTCVILSLLLTLIMRFFRK